MENVIVSYNVPDIDNGGLLYATKWLNKKWFSIIKSGKKFPLFLLKSLDKY